jgi:glycosyltransferase involved in cell wall biosynthesis
MESNWDIRKDEPVVSVCIVTYKHAPYIRECIESALNQKTDFPYEICIGEDESPDSTREICQEYAEKYPEKIRLFLHSREDVIYSFGYPTGRFNFLQTIKNCRGKYIAYCEGDDYWQDLEKLQKQVSFMEQHSDYSMCHSDTDCLSVIEGTMTKNAFKKSKEEAELEDNLAPIYLNKKYKIHTCTVLARRDYLARIFEEHADEFDGRFMGADFQMWFHLMLLGKVKYFDDSMSVHRLIPNSATARNDIRKRFCCLKNGSRMRHLFAERYDMKYVEGKGQVIRNYGFLLAYAVKVQLMMFRKKALELIQTAPSQ